MKHTRGDTLVTQTAIATSYSYDLCLDNIDGAALQVTYTDGTPAAKTFVDADVTVIGDIIAKTAHGFPNGLKVAATNAGGALPAGLSTTNYYVYRIDADSFKLCSSLANVLTTTAVDITAAAGGGTHTLTPAALGGIVVKLQCSNDGTNFDDHASYTVTISAAGTKMWNLADQYYRYARVLHTPSAGALTLTVVLNAKSSEA